MAGTETQQTTANPATVPDPRTVQVAIPETPVQKLQDKVSRFLDILRETLPEDSRLKILDRFDSDPTTSNFAAAFRALERALGSSNFRRSATANNLVEANSLYQDMLADLDIKGTSSRFTLGRSSQLREQYDKLSRGEDISVHCSVDARGDLAGTVGRNAFTCNESGTLSSKFGLPVGMIMNPDEGGFNQTILSLILRTTKDSKTYDGISPKERLPKLNPDGTPVLDENGAPVLNDPTVKKNADGTDVKFSYADLVKKNPGQYTPDEYHAVMEAFKNRLADPNNKSGANLDTTYSIVNVEGQWKVNQPMIDYLVIQAEKRNDYKDRTELLTGLKYLQLAAEQAAKARNTPTPAATPAPGTTTPPTTTPPAADNSGW